MPKFTQSQYLFKVKVKGVVGYVHAFWSNGEWKTRTFKSAPTITGGIKSQDWEKVKAKLGEDGEGLVAKVEEAIQKLEQKLQPRIKVKSLASLGLVPASALPPPRKKKTAE